ncbi:hypothetical protein HK104_002678 [Borealophlyctis nickersoniae]|nr:hypothetical protein HK104_002678 [Borealophlyctis nickersoniae]
MNLGRIHGIDVSSGIAVHALDVQKDDHVLDLCCAPGGKLCYVADLQGPDGVGTVTLWASRSRAMEDRTRYPKAAPSNGQDGIFGSKSAGQLDLYIDAPEISEEDEASSPQSPAVKIKPFHAPKRLRSDPQIKSPEFLYDKVLVDAECTHDGSVVHLLKYDRVGWDTFESKFLDPKRLNNLEKLQRGLISNGFKL